MQLTIQELLPLEAIYGAKHIDWLGVVPNSWEIVPLKFLAHEVTETIDGKPEDLTYIGLEHIESWTGRLKLDNVIDQVAGNVSAFQQGDVIFGKLRPYLAKAFLAEFDGVGTTETVIYRPGPNIDGRYLLYLFLSEPFVKAVDATTFGAKMPRASPELISSFRMPVPPLPRQRAIAAFLDQETAQIDALLTAQERLLQALAEKRQALITQAVTRGLDPAVPLQKTGLPWLGEIPAHWKVKPLRRALVSMDYGTSESTTYVGDVAILRMGDVQAGEIDFNNLAFLDEVPSELLLQPGDLVFNRTNSLEQIGKVALYRGNYQGNLSFASYLVRFRCGTDCLPDFLNYLLNIPRVLAWARSEALPAIGQVNLNPNRYGYMPIALPPMKEQVEIASRVQVQDQQLSNSVRAIRFASASLQERRTSLIAAAVTGQMEVRE